MADDKGRKVHIVEIKRMMNSASGNPRWCFRDEQGNIYVTEPDNVAAYMPLTHYAAGHDWWVQASSIPSRGLNEVTKVTRA